MSSHSTRTTNVAILSGSLPPEQKDGVGDYTSNLYRVLQDVADVSMVHHPLDVGTSPLRWLSSLKEQVKGFRLLHIQYPCEGWGNSVLPGFLPGFLRFSGLGMRIVVTLHEWIAMHPLRKFSILPLVLLSDAMIFVSRREEDAFKRSIWGRLKKSFYVPIGINLNVIVPKPEKIEEFRSRVFSCSSNAKRSILLSHFGFLYKAKQVDKMLQVVRELIDADYVVKLILVGDFNNDDHKYRKFIEEEIASLCVGDSVVFKGYVSDPAEVSIITASSDAVFCIYDDGLSFRRGSFWYATQMRTQIITTAPQYPKEFEGYEEILSNGQTIFVSEKASAREIAGIIVTMLPYSPLRFKSVAVPSWNDIARSHAQIYDQV